MKERIVNARDRNLFLIQVLSIFVVIISGYVFGFTEGFSKQVVNYIKNETLNTNGNFYLSSAFIFLLPSVLLILNKKRSRIKLFDLIIYISSVIFQFSFVLTGGQAGNLIDCIAKGNIPVILWSFSYFIFTISTIVRFCFAKIAEGDMKIEFRDFIKQFRTVQIIFLSMIIVSTWMFSFTKGLMTDENTFCIDWPSSVSDDNTIFFFSYVLVIPLFISAFRFERKMGILEFALNLVIFSFQLLFIIFGLDAGSIILTLKYSLNIPLFLWNTMFYGYIIVTIILFVSNIFYNRNIN